MADTASPRAENWAIWIAGRTVLCIPSRVIYPFLPAIARGLGVPLAVAAQLVSLRLAGGLAAPFTGALSDRYGRRRLMVAGLLLFALAGMALAGIGTVSTAAVAFALFGLGKAIYDPALQAYIGDAVPYAQRGRAIGLIEFSWSGAWLLGVPATGFLMERMGWRAPWAALAVLGLAGAGWTHLGLPSDAPDRSVEHRANIVTSTLQTWHNLLRRRDVLALLTATVLLNCAIDVPFIVYGAWIESTFGLSLSALGLASAVVGLAEAAGELGTAAFTDRLGKRRSVLLGLVAMAASLILLPWLARLGLGPALLGIVLLMLPFEFAIVSLLPLATELAPDSRASLMSLNLTAGALGRMAAATAGSWIWRWHNMTWNTLAGAACALATALVLALWVPDDSPRRRASLDTTTDKE